MNSFIVAVAQYLLFVILATAGIIWLCLPRRDKVGLAFQAIVSLVIAVVLIGVAAASTPTPGLLSSTPRSAPCSPILPTTVPGGLGGTRC